QQLQDRASSVTDGSANDLGSVNAVRLGSGDVERWQGSVLTGGTDQKEAQAGQLVSAVSSLEGQGGPIVNPGVARRIAREVTPKTKTPKNPTPSPQGAGALANVIAFVILGLIAAG